MAEWSKVAVLKTDRTKNSHEFESRFTRENLTMMRVSINGKLSAFQAEFKGSSPFVRRILVLR